MALKEANRLRLERLTARFDAHRARPAATADARARFEADFRAACEATLVPLLREIGAELERAGHRYAIEPDGDPRRPSLVFRVDLLGKKPGNANAIGFFVQHDGLEGKSEVIPYLALMNEFDLGRFQSIEEMTREALEQMLVDGVEHMLVCNEA